MMSNKEIKNKITNVLQLVSMKATALHIQNQCGVLAYLIVDKQTEYWWLDDGSCIFLYNIDLDICRYMKFPHLNIVI